MAAPDTGSPDTGKWNRLSPFAVIHYVVKFLGALIQHGPQAIVPLLALLVVGGEQRWFYIGLAAAAVGALMVAGAILSYLRFRFRLADGKILIQSGVFNRKRLTLGFDRIQNITLMEPLYFRLFGLVAMDVESMGSSKVEVSLGGIPRVLAEEIRKTVLSHKPAHTTARAEVEGGSESRSETTEAPTEIIRQSTADLVRYGLSNNQTWIFAAMSSGIIVQVLTKSEIFIALKAAIDLNTDNSTILMVLFIIFSILFTLFLFMVASVIGAIITNHNYHMTYLDGRFHRTRGFFERQEVTLPEGRIQTIKIRQSWQARLLKRFQLHLDQIAFCQGSGGKHFFIPCVTEKFAVQFSRFFYPDFDWPAMVLKKIDRMFIRKKLLWTILPVSALPAIIITVVSGSIWGLLPLLLLPLSLPFLALRWVNYGYASDGKYGLVREGFVGHQLTVFPFFKVQNVVLSQSPAQKKAGLASLKIKMASSTVKIPFMPLRDASDWRNMMLYHVESSRKSWM